MYLAQSSRDSGNGSGINGCRFGHALWSARSNVTNRPLSVCFTHHLTADKRRGSNRAHSQRKA